MSGNNQHNLGASLLSPLAETLAAHQALPPDKKAANYAYVGAFLCAASAYVFFLSPEAVHYLAVLAGVFAWGGFLLVVGWRGSRGLRNPLGAMMALLIPAGGFFAVSSYWPEVFDYFWAQAFSAGVIGANLVRFWIDIRGPSGGNAEKRVRKRINEQDVAWKPVRRR